MRILREEWIDVGYFPYLFIVKLYLEMPGFMKE